MTPREAELTEQLKQCRQALKEALARIALLEQKNDLLIRRFFGKSSEQLDPGQLDLFLAQVEVPASPTPQEPLPPLEKVQSSPRKSREPRLPEDLQVIEVFIDPEPVKAAPDQWRCIGEEVSEQLDFEPAQFLRRRVIRRKYVSRQDEDRAPVIAELPACLQERGMAAPGLLAHVVVSKYCDHLPLYRQEQIYQRRHGVYLPRQTLARWMDLAADWLQPVYDQIRVGVLAGGYVQVDETPIEYLDPGHGQTRQGYLWVCSQPGGDVFFQWETSRAAACLEKLIVVNFNGVLQCDGYAAYPSFVASRKGTISQAGCWAHVRRPFHEALEQAPRTASWILRQLQHLYRIEARLREGKAGPRLREAVRAHESRPIVARIKRAVTALKASRRHLPQSTLGQAFDYTLGQWSTLEVYLGDGRVEIDNNLVENAIRPTALGKKNWLFIGDAEAGDRGAILYTIVESCRRRGIDPYAYLRDVLTRLPRTTNHQVRKLTPAAWLADREHKPLRAAS